LRRSDKLETIIGHARPFADELVSGLTWPGIVVLAAVLAASLAGGFLVGLSGFAVNLLAGIVGLVVAVVAGILFIDRLPDRSRDRAWRHVREHTCELLRAHIISFAVSCWLETRLEQPPPGGSVLHLRDRTPHQSAHTIEWLKQLAHTVRAGGPLSAGPASRILAAARWDLGQVTDILTPTITALSSDPVLIQRLASLTNAATQAQLALILAESQERSGLDPQSQTAWQAIADALKAAAGVLERISA